ncbi:MAG: hypothetical protein WBP11_00250 [Dokdonella sp.]
MRYAVIAALATFAVVPVAHAYDLDVVNKSKTTIHHLYLSSSNDREWGPDQLGDSSDDVVEPGDTFTLTDIERGRFDVKIVAEDDTECEVENARFNEGKEWVITERMLDDCAE